MMRPLKKAYYLNAFLFFVVAGTLTGCGMIFSGKKQKVTLQSGTPGATITVGNERPAKNSVKVKLNKKAYYQTALVEKEGYKSINYAFQIDKFSPTMAFSILDLAIPIYGWVCIPTEFVAPQNRKYQKYQRIPALIPYDKRKTSEKYMLINNTAIDAVGSNIMWHNYLSIAAFQEENHKDSRAVRKSNRSEDREDIKVDNTIFTDALNNTLMKMNFVDTTHSVFPNINNSLYLNATIKKITFHYVRSRLSKKYRWNAVFQPNNLLSVELEVNWEVLNFYKEKVDSLKTFKKSDLFVITHLNAVKDFKSKLIDAMNDNMEYSVMEVRKKLSEKGILNISATKQEKMDDIVIAKPEIAPGARMNDFLKSSVTVKVDDGHGSGIVISKDGLVLTAYHVVTGSKKIEVVFNDGTKLEAELVRRNTEADLALLKVNKTDLAPLPISQVQDPEIGVDVWAIGTPKSEELGQSVSKGILSGLRKANDVNYLQTDVSINGGNSGGALITKDGTILGIITSKLVGIGTEGVGFAISSREIFDRLKIAYK